MQNKEIQNYLHLCTYGCGGKIKILNRHRWHGIPEYISGHNPKKKPIKHGYRYTRLYKIWQGIKDRCLNKNNPRYKDYGGRNIKVCNDWLEFIPFRDWALNNGYTDNLTIDRIDNSLGYYPYNCRWITKIENNRNKRNNVISSLEQANEIRDLYKTEKYTQKELAIKYNINVNRIFNIIHNYEWKNQ